MRTRRKTIFGTDWQIFDVVSYFRLQEGDSRTEYLKKKLF